MKSVRSSNVGSVGFENGTMRVQFKGGGLYQYSGVPESLYGSFMSASSPGSFFRSHFSGRYGEAKIG